MSRIDELILAGADPGADDISKAAMLKTIEEFLYSVGFSVGVFSRKARLMCFWREERSENIGKGRGATSSDLRNVVLAQCSVDLATPAKKELL